MKLEEFSFYTDFKYMEVKWRVTHGQLQAGEKFTGLSQNRLTHSNREVNMMKITVSNQRIREPYCRGVTCSYVQTCGTLHFPRKNTKKSPMRVSFPDVVVLSQWS